MKFLKKRITHSKKIHNFKTQFCFKKKKWMTHLRIIYWILLSYFANFISQITSLNFGKKFIRFFHIFKFYFANYLSWFHWILEKNLSDFFFIEFWKKIYPIFSFFKILFHELFIKFWKKKLFDFSGFQILFRELFIEFFCVFKIYLLFHKLLIQIWKIWKQSKF